MNECVFAACARVLRTAAQALLCSLLSISLQASTMTNHQSHGLLSLTENVPSFYIALSIARSGSLSRSRSLCLALSRSVLLCLALSLCLSLFLSVGLSIRLSLSLSLSLRLYVSLSLSLTLSLSRCASIATPTPPRPWRQRVELVALLMR